MSSNEDDQYSPRRSLTADSSFSTGSQEQLIAAVRRISLSRERSPVQRQASGTGVSLRPQGPSPQQSPSPSPQSYGSAGPIARYLAAEGDRGSSTASGSPRYSLGSNSPSSSPGRGVAIRNPRRPRARPGLVAKRVHDQTADTALGTVSKSSAGGQTHTPVPTTQESSSGTAKR